MRERFLLEVHARDPGWTRRAFERAGSYQLVADATPPGDVLELGAGDGALIERLGARAIALDLSPDELARIPAAVPRVRARAQALPFRDRSFDAVVSHLVWMLVPDAAALADEAARVLRPGGAFVALIGGGPTVADDAYARLAAHARPSPAPPDPRLRSSAGIASLLHGLDDVRQIDHHLDLAAPVATVHARLTADYGFAAGAPSLDAFTAACADLVRADGTVPCAVHVRLVTARAKRP